MYIDPQPFYLNVGSLTGQEIDPHMYIFLENAVIKTPQSAPQGKICTALHM